MSILNSGDLASLNSSVQADDVDNFSSAGVVITGTWVGTLTFEGSLDGTNFKTMLAVLLDGSNMAATTTGNNSYIISTCGLKSVRVKMTAYTSGTATIVIQGAKSQSFMSTIAMLRGGTDGTRIGNVSDRLKVDTAFSTTQSTSTAIIKLYYDDMNVANGGVARDTSITTSYTTIYNKSGAGLIYGFSVSFEGNIIGADEFLLKFTVDSLVIAEISTADIGTNALYALGADGDVQILGWQVANNNVMFKAPGGGGVRYNATVKIEIKKVTGSSKRFRAGLIGLTKE